VEKLYIVFSMDCERIASESPPGGPKTWDFSERSIQSYSDILLDAGFPATLFVVPECGVRHADMLRELGRRGIDLGMHLHPQSFLDLQFDKYLGEYNAATQRDLIERGADMLTSAFGSRPTSFRSGNCSASDDTFPILSELGFRQGAMSIPDRDIAEYVAHWAGADPFVHWASATDRGAAGDLPFLELPVTTIPGQMQPNGEPYEMRIEFGSAEEWHIPVLEAALVEMERRESEFRAVCIDTHNFLDYGNPSDDRTVALHGIIKHLQAMTSHEIVPATLVTLRDAYVRDVGEPV
jgi:hypothetical protein